MSLARLLVLTDRSMCSGGGDPAALRAVIAAAIEFGARAVVVRERDLPVGERAGLIADARAILAPVGGVLITAGPNGDAVHLAARDPFPAVRPDLVGRSCHDAAEVARASAEGCDYVTISPVFPTPSKPGYGPALTLSGLAEMIPGAPAAYALGGVRPSDVAGCLGAGARGIAVMGPVMRTPRIVEDYLAALEEVSA
ncbi:MAG TPA: thiamine phosphate synthase [Pilimelia sp.]|nr:thiamine phosphate synthase [Pilimelia sp.]